GRFQGVGRIRTTVRVLAASAYEARPGGSRAWWGCGGISAPAATAGAQGHSDSQRQHARESRFRHDRSLTPQTCISPVRNLHWTSLAAIKTALWVLAAPPSGPRSISAG